jgi:hypothetical protein
MSGAEGRASAQSSKRFNGGIPNPKPRIPSSRIDDGELKPSDSASNAPSRRTPSISQKMAPTHRVPVERRTERTTITTKDTVHIRTKSQPKTTDNADVKLSNREPEVRLNGINGHKESKPSL